MPFRLKSNRALEQHIERVRRVNRRYDPPLIDFWAPGIVDALENVHIKRGRCIGEIDGYRLRYFEGRDEAVELDILDRETGRRIAQDGSSHTAVLDRLRVRIARSES